MKRAVVLLGAGASIEYGAPSTVRLTEIIEQRVRNDDIMWHTGCDAIYLEILARLTGYLENPGIVNFEHIYHCVHELIFTFPPTAGAVDEFRPLLVPFITTNFGVEQDARQALQALADKIIEVIYAEASQYCTGPAVSLAPVADFIARLRHDYITRIYTTNYDDFTLQAVPDLYTGFNPAAQSPKRFELEPFWQSEDRASLFQLHGSVHMGFSHPPTAGIGELVWFAKIVTVSPNVGATAIDPKHMGDGMGDAIDFAESPMFSNETGGCGGSPMRKRSGSSKMSRVAPGLKDDGCSVLRNRCDPGRSHVLNRAPAKRADAFKACSDAPFQTEVVNAT